MRKILLLGLVLFSFNSFASHLLGGSLTWEYVGSNQYIFQLDIYKECYWLNNPSTLNVLGPNGIFTVNLQSSVDITIGCTGNTNTPCSSATGQGSAKKHTYKTNGPITLNGPIPNTGWKFSHTLDLRGTGVINTKNPIRTFHIESTMYPVNGIVGASSPQFDSNPAHVITRENQSLSAYAQPGQHGDSLHFEFYRPMLGLGIPDTFSTGYSFNSPFPSNVSHPQNGLVTIDSKSGLIKVNITTATNGIYMYGVKVEQWRDKQLTAVVHRDYQGMINIPPSGTPSLNDIPTTAIDTSIYNSIVRNGTNYRMLVKPGDTVAFQIVGIDNDLNISNGQLQRMDFRASGFPLDSITWGGRNNYVNKALLTPTLPQVVFNSVLFNRIDFKWIIGQEHLTANSGSPYVFNFQFADDECSYNGVSNNVMSIYVKATVEITGDTLRLCEGDSIILFGSTFSGNFQWTPALDISSTSIARPYVYPDSSRYYYLSDPSNPGLLDSIYIDVTPSGSFTLALNNGQLTLSDSAQTSTRIWHYNGIPFVYAYDTLSPFGLGDYFVKGQSGACLYLTDTISLKSLSALSVTSPSNGGYAGTSIPFTGSLGTSIQLNQDAYVTSVILPGLKDIFGKTGGYDLKLQVFDSSQIQILVIDITLQKPINELLYVPVSNLKLDANVDYTFSISGDTGYAFSVFENFALPSSPFNAGYTVKSALEGNYAQFPGSTSSYLLPLSFELNRGINLNENDFKSWSIYPNPATDEIRISGLENALAIDVIDVSGVLARQLKLNGQETSVLVKRNTLPKGLYFVKVHFENASSVKKVLFQ